MKKNWILMALLILLLSGCSADVELPAENEVKPQAVQSEPAAPSVQTPEKAEIAEPEKPPVASDKEKADEKKPDSAAAASEEQAAEAEQPDETVAPQAPVVPAEAPQTAAEQPVQTTEPTPPAVSARDAALSCIGGPLSSLTAQVGQPLSAIYESSCSGPGEDGILTFSDVTVFTYREPDGSAETIIDAE